MHLTPEDLTGLTQRLDSLERLAEHLEYRIDIASGDIQALYRLRELDRADAHNTSAPVEPSPKPSTLPQPPTN